MPRHHSGLWVPLSLKGRGRSRSGCRAQGDGRIKMRFVSAASAKAAASNAEATDGSRLFAYSCPDCNGYHIGHPARFNRPEQFRHFIDWEVEMGERASAHLWLENQSSAHRRLNYFRRLAATVDRINRRAAA